MTTTTTAHRRLPRNRTPTPTTIITTPDLRPTTTAPTSVAAVPTGIHRHGRLDVVVARRGSRTVLDEQRLRFPAGTVRLTDPDGDGVAELQLTNPSGGLLAGDRLDTVVRATAGTRVSVVTQGANRVCGVAAGAAPTATVVRTTLTVEGDAIVEWIPHHLVPYARSRVHQRTTVDVAPRAGLILWDTLSTGRSARGERCAWDAVDTRLRITRVGHPLVVDGAILGPGGEPFDRADLAATFVAVLPSHAEPSTGTGSALADVLHASGSTVRGAMGSASALDRDLVVGRILARDAAALYRALAAWRTAARAALGLPPVRRPVD